MRTRLATKQRPLSWLLVAAIWTGVAACGGQGVSPSSTQTEVTPSQTAPSLSQPSTEPSAAATAATIDPTCNSACQLLMQMQHPGLTRPGPLPAGSYTTKHFYPGGLTVTVDDSWASHEDSTGEFNLAPQSTPDDSILFWLDMTPVTFDGTPVAGLDNTPEAVSEWLHGLDWLTVTPAAPTKIGQAGIPALVMDLTIPGGAPNGDPMCPTVSCVNAFTWPQFDGPWAMSSDMKVRLWLAQIGDGPHMLYVVLNVINADTFAPLAAPVIDSIKLSDQLD